MTQEMKKQETEEKPVKKKLIHVEGRAGNVQGYEFSSINFAFVASSAHNRRQATGTMTCREHFNRTFWHAVRKEKDGYYNPDSDPPIDLEKLRILIVYNPREVSVETFKSKLFNGKACLNLLEKINGWKPSSITTVKHSSYKNAWLLTGPSEWLYQPQLLSLATWVLRLSAIYGPIASDSFDAFESNLKKMAEVSPSNSNSDASTFVKAFWDKIYILLKYHNEIWEHMDFKKGWDLHTDKGFGSQSGLLTFVRGDLEYSDNALQAYKKFKSLCNKYLPRKK